MAVFGVLGQHLLAYNAFKAAVSQLRHLKQFMKHFTYLAADLLHPMPIEFCMCVCVCVLSLCMRVCITAGVDLHMAHVSAIFL